MAMCKAIRKGSVMQLLAIALMFFPLSGIGSTHGAKVDLMQYHHRKSPYATSNLSILDQDFIATKSSHERAEILSKLKQSIYQGPMFLAQGSYIMEVQVGSPPQTKVTIADTGNDLFWLECQYFVGSCFPEPDPTFNPIKLLTYSLINCSNAICVGLPQASCGANSECLYNCGYGDDSIPGGALASDMLMLGSEKFHVEFGCRHRNHRTFLKTDGLVGLGRGPALIITQIGNNFGNVFSYCLVSFFDSGNQTSPLYFPASLRVKTLNVVSWDFACA